MKCNSDVTELTKTKRFYIAYLLLEVASQRQVLFSNISENY